jgi:transposase-like protein
MPARGVLLDPATMQRGGVPYRPLLDVAFQRRQRSVWLSWRRDETSIKGQGPWDYLYGVVAKTGQTMACLLTAPRDEAPARRLLQKGDAAARRAGDDHERGQ